MFNLKTEDHVDVVTFNSLQSVGLITTTPKNIKTSQAKFFGYITHNPNAVEAWIQCFFIPAASVVLGTTPPDFTIKMLANGGVAWDFRSPLHCQSGLSVAATTTETGSTAGGTGLSGTFYFK